MNARTLPLLAAGLLAAAVPVLANDWPQWRGPDRDDISKETGLLKTWPKEGPKVLWTFREAGAGYSGPSVVGDRLYCMGADDKSDTIFCLDVQTGKRIWSTPVAPESILERGDGPRGSPTVDGELVYGETGQGDLVCVERSTGKQKWQKSLTKDLGGSLMVPKWGYSESPLVDGDKVICTPGGKDGALAALDKLTGAVLWRSRDVTDAAGYSSPIVADVGGVRQYVQLTAKAVIGVDAKEGKLLWRYDDTGFQTAVIPTAIFHDDYVFATSGYKAGCELLHLVPDGSGTKAEKVYRNNNMVNHHGGVVLVRDHLYGYSDGSKAWVCLEIKTGKPVWAEKKLDKGSLTCADTRLYCYGEDSGTVALVEASPAGWKEDGRFTIPEKSQIRKPGGTKFWTHPVVANGRLYLRDQDLLFCYDVKDHAAGSR
jgi:outer membrane protein assembly factor BamB